MSAIPSFKRSELISLAPLSWFREADTIVVDGVGWIDNLAGVATLICLDSLDSLSMLEGYWYFVRQGYYLMGASNEAGDCKLAPIRASGKSHCTSMPTCTPAQEWQLLHDGRGMISRMNDIRHRS